MNRYPWGMVWEDGRANIRNLAGPDRWVETSPVASFQAGGWGLHDMVGNALEWVADAYHRDYRELPTDGRPWNQVTGPDGPPKRVLRGGSFMSLPPEARLSQRWSRAPDNPGRTTGFRCAADGP